MANSGSQSFTSVLVHICRLIKPKRILEWGPGYSTQVMIDECPDAYILTIEHDKKWFKKTVDLYGANKNVDVVYRKHTMKAGEDEGYATYPLRRFLDVPYDLHSFDLVFVDGRSRVDCLTVGRICLSGRGVVIVHDAWREEYWRAIRCYSYWWYVKKYGTAVMSCHDLDMKLFGVEMNTGGLGEKDGCNS